MKMKLISDQIEESRGWLFNMQDPESKGWPTEYKSKNISTLNTGEVIISLLSCNHILPTDDKHKIHDALKYLVSNQTIIGSWEKTGGNGNGEHSDLIRTTTACRAIIGSIVCEITKDLDPLLDSLNKGIEWIKALRNDDGGWGYNRMEASGVFETCFVLRLLIDLRKNLSLIDCSLKSTDIEYYINSGLKFIQDRYSSVMDDNTIHHLIHILLCFQYSEKPEYESHSNSIIKWISSRKSSVLSFKEENVLLENNESYVYTVLTDTLLLEALSNENRSRKSLMKKTIQSINKRIDHSGGVYGNKCFSWSTSKTINSFYGVLNKSNIMYLYSEKLSVKWIPIVVSTILWVILMLLPAILVSSFSLLSQSTFESIKTPWLIIISIVYLINLFKSLYDMDILSPILRKIPWN